MLSSIGKFSKSLVLKIFVGIIILPFVFWGMGDIFRGGNQNIVATIDSEKLSTQEFVNYLNRLNLTEKEKNELKNAGLMEKILSEYIGKKIINLEVKDLGIILSDKSLKNIIVNDKAFFKDKKFSRTKYEKFLLENGISAPSFERNLSEQEKRRQLLSFLSQGTYISDFLIQNAYSKENQIKDIEYIDLNNFYDKQKISEDEIKETYDKNKDLFNEIYKSIKFAELNPSALTGKKEFSKSYFSKIDKIENDILDGKSFKSIAEENSLKLIETDGLNFEKKNILGVESNNINDDLFKIFFKIENTNSPEVKNIKNKYYIVEISSNKKISRGIKNKNVNEAIVLQIKLKNKVENNVKVAKEISNGLFNREKMDEYAKINNLEIKSSRIRSVKNNEVFNKDIIKEIFKMSDSQINIITDSTLSKSFIVFIKKTENIKLHRNHKDYTKYKTTAKLNLAKEIYQTYDKSVNAKYKIDINVKTVDRIKNSF